MKSEGHQRAICILGMHRSGTSAITRALNLLGAYLGEEEDLSATNPNNPKGFWERKDIIDLHDRILSFLGGDWHTLAPLPKEWNKSEDIKPFRAELIDLVRKNFSGHALWAWKDPRTCIFLPLWIDVLNELGVKLSCVFVVRNPLDVAKSLSKRNNFSYDKSFGLWFYYNIEALQASQAVPRHFMSYDSFLTSWEMELRKCSERMKIGWPTDDSKLKKEMSDFIHPDLRHSTSRQNDLRKVGAPQFVLNLYQLLEKVIDTSSILEPSFINTAEGLYQESSCYRHIFHDYTEKLHEQLNHKNNKIAQLQAAVNAQQEELNWVCTSLEWRLLRQYKRSRDKIFPTYTRRRKVLDLLFLLVKSFPSVFRLGKVIVNEGRRGFIHELLIRNYQKGGSADLKFNSWIFKNEPDKSQLRAMRLELNSFSYQPKVSIITPVYNPNEYDLTECLKSVLLQTYPNWELCLVDGGVGKPYVKEVIKRFAKKDHRIKYVFLPENKGIAGNSNEALKLATGEYVAFLDHDDTLAPFALYEVVKLLNRDATIDFIYSDEDKESLEDKKRYEPFFKPDWSPDTLLSYNYACHFAVARKRIVDAIGGFREGFDEAQYHDLILRIIEKTDMIYHIPKILYHWKAASSVSAASRPDAKLYAFAAGKKAIKEYLNKKGLEADVLAGLFTGSYRVKYRITQPQKVSIIIPTKDKVHLLKKCVSSILDRTDYKEYEILIVDNQSKEQETYNYYSSIIGEPRIRILKYDKPFNYSAINNFAVQSTDAEFLLFLNNDIEVISQEWLSAMLEFAQREDVGAVGAKLYYPDDTIQHAGVILGLYGIADHAHRYFPRSSVGVNGRINVIQNLSAVTGGCMLMRRNVFEEVGGFNETMTVAYNDIDLCLKVREKGYLIVYTPYAELYHYESASRGKEDTPEKLTRANQEYDFMKTKWKHILEAGDPYYNPNLTLKNTDFSIKV